MSNETEDLKICKSFVEEFGWPSNAKGVKIFCGMPYYYYDDRFSIFLQHYTKGEIVSENIRVNSTTSGTNK